MKILLSNRSGVPIYGQIYEQFKRQIFAGEIREDELLPSLRQLARDLKISVITTTRAYTDLEREGFVINVQGKGCYVLPRNKELAHENVMHQIEAGLMEVIRAAKRESVAKEEVIERLDLLWEEDYE